MKKTTLPKDAVQLQPKNEAALSLGVAPADQPGLLSAQLVVETETLGTFVVPLTAEQLGVMATVSRTLLNLTAEQAADIREQLEDNNDE